MRKIGLVILVLASVGYLNAGKTGYQREIVRKRSKRRAGKSSGNIVHQAIVLNGVEKKKSTTQTTIRPKKLLTWKQRVSLFCDELTDLFDNRYLGSGY